MTETDHNKLIKSAAKSVLRPLGCQQKGSSRTWLDPHPFWVGVIEFQPSSWSKGSYLNVGACWLWFENDHLSFDDGYRVAQFQSFEAGEGAAEAALALATQARDETIALRKRFASLEAIAAHLKAKPFSNIHDNYHAAVAATLTNDLVHAEERFSAIANDNHDRQWAVTLKERAAELQRMSHRPEQFLEAVNAIIARKKILLKIV